MPIEAICDDILSPNLLLLNYHVTICKGVPLLISPSWAFLNSPENVLAHIRNYPARVIGNAGEGPLSLPLEWEWPSSSLL